MALQDKPDALSENGRFPLVPTPAQVDTIEVHEQFGSDLATTNDDPPALLPVLDRLRAGVPA